MKNPYRIVSNVVNTAAKVLCFLVAAAAVLIFLSALIYRLGWWTVLWVPGVIVGCAVVMILLSLLEDLCKHIARWWRNKIWEWDREHRTD